MLFFFLSKFCLGSLYYVFLVVFLFMLKFSYFYMSTGNSMNMFTLLYLSFFFFMFVLLESNSWYFFMLGWEMMSLFSFVLISWFSGRSLASNSAGLAFLSNWVSDIFFFGSILCGSFFLLVFSALSKSSMWLFSSWLPNAMEGPTPVSTLLHSSTMVVAGVFLMLMFNYISIFFCFFLLISGCFMGRNGAYFHDYKRIMAYSTSSQLILVSVLGLLSSELSGSNYILVHAFFKSLLFMSCGWLMHANFSQFVKSNYNYSMISGCIFSLCFIMCGLPFFSVASMKDVMLFSPLSGFFFTIFFIYAGTTILYSKKLSLMTSKEHMMISEVGSIVLIYSVYFMLNFFCFSNMLFISNLSFSSCFEFKYVFIFFFFVFYSKKAYMGKYKKMQNLIDMNYKFGLSPGAQGFMSFYVLSLGKFYYYNFFFVFLFIM